MRKILILLIMLMAATMAVAACEEEESGITADSTAATGNGQATAPQWLTELIAGMEAAPVRNPPGEVIRYEYQGGTVYYVPAECCDQLSTLYDADGNVICSPDGGIGGRGDGRCPDFLDSRQDKEVVWQDSRT
jgi:hypothetical protein